MIYFLVAIYLFMLSYIYDFRGYNKNLKLHYFVSLSVLILIAGLRFRMAPDSIVYLNDYIYRIDKLSNLSLHEILLSRYQPFWIVLNALCKQISNDFVTMQFATSVILNVSVFYFFRKSTTKVFTCVFFYFLTSYLYFNMEIMRESLAVAMFLLSLLMFNEKKHGKCFLLVVFAVLFHAYAILLGLVYLFISDVISRRTKVVVSVMLVLLVTVIPEPLLVLGSLLGGSASSSILEYNDSKLGTISITGYIYMLLRIGVVYYGIQKVKQLTHIPYILLDKKIFVNLGILYIALVVIRTVSIPFLERILNYFTIAIIVFLTAIFFHYLRNYKFTALRGNLYAGMILIICFYNIYPMFKFIEEWNAPFYRRYYPYNSVFVKEHNVEREYINYVESKEY